MSDTSPTIPAGLAEPDAALFLGIGESTLRGKRLRGQLPAGLYVRPTARRLVYLTHFLKRWLELGCPATWPPGEPRQAG